MVLSAEPVEYRQATAAAAPGPDSVLLLVLAVDSARLRCDHDVTPPISMMDWTPAASVLAYTDSCTNAEDRANAGWCLPEMPE